MFLYVLSIAFQISGAVILVIKYCFTSVEKQIEIIQNKRTRVKEETLIIKDGTPSNCELVSEIWLNRFAFSYIALGYILGIFGKNDYNKLCCETVLIVVLTAVFVLIGKLVSDCKGKKY